MLRAVTPGDLAAIVAALVEKAKAGDVTAAREVLDRCIGKATPAAEPAASPAALVFVSRPPGRYATLCPPDDVLRCALPRIVGEPTTDAGHRVVAVVPDRDG